MDFGDLFKFSFGLFFVYLILAAIYLIPSIIVALGSKRHSTAIVVLNLFAGWSIVGWVLALVWAIKSPSET